MRPDQSMIEGKWLSIKDEVKKAWGNLTDDELEKAKGDVKAIGGLIQRKYGTAQETFEPRLSEIFKKYASEKENPNGAKSGMQS